MLVVMELIEVVLGVLEDGLGGSKNDGDRIIGVLDMMEVGFLGY